MIRFCVLGSSSSGNSVFVQVDKTQILLDCGFSYKKIRLKLASINRAPANIGAMFISHNEHGDHFQGVPVFKKKHPNVAIYSHDLQHGKAIIFGCAVVIPFNLDHDVPCMGFVVQDNTGNKLAYITDTGTIPCESLEYLLDCKAVIIECNHDLETLENCSYDNNLKKRIRKTHLRNEQARDLLYSIEWNGLEAVVAYHLSDNANNVELVKYELSKAVDCEIVVADGVADMMCII